MKILNIFGWSKRKKNKVYIANVAKTEFLHDYDDVYKINLQICSLIEDLQ